MPEVAIGLNEETDISLFTYADFSYFAFNLNIHIYAFDLSGDRKNPTFSKQGSLFKKGFFFTVAHGLMYSSNILPIIGYQISILAIRLMEKLHRTMIIIVRFTKFSFSLDLNFGWITSLTIVK